MIWRGEVYDVDLGQPLGHEAGFVRMAVIVSTDAINNGPGELVAVVPIASKSYGLRSHIELEPGRSGLNQVSYARCDQLHVISTRRLSTPRRGALTVLELSAIGQALRFILEL